MHVAKTCRLVRCDDWAAPIYNLNNFSCSTTVGKCTGDIGKAEDLIQLATAGDYQKQKDIQEQHTISRGFLNSFEAERTHSNLD